MSWIFKIAATIIIVLGHVALSGSSNPILSSINLPIAFLVLSIRLFDFPFKLAFALLAGFILDVYSNLPFGSFMITFFLISISLDVLFYNFFTDRSLYSILVLSLIGITIYNFSFILILSGSYLLGFSDFLVNQNYIWNYLLQLLVNGLVIAIGFYLSNRLLKFK
ncbi:MAG: hypothetical protein BWY53_00459 [Parcubacteria group bacterium ADurb.Bin326]|nr:MAG: hypothetical protein BWY53_00459 [Parcubacteria group bacterium ADurb.Bin326]